MTRKESDEHFKTADSSRHRTLSWRNRKTVAGSPAPHESLNDSEEENDSELEFLTHYPKSEQPMSCNFLKILMNTPSLFVSQDSTEDSEKCCPMQPSQKQVHGKQETPCHFMKFCPNPSNVFTPEKEDAAILAHGVHVKRRGYHGPKARLKCQTSTSESDEGAFPSSDNSVQNKAVLAYGARPKRRSAHGAAAHIRTTQARPIRRGSFKNTISPVPKSKHFKNQLDAVETSGLPCNAEMLNDSNEAKSISDTVCCLKNSDSFQLDYSGTSQDLINVRRLGYSGPQFRVSSQNQEKKPELCIKDCAAALSTLGFATFVKILSKLEDTKLSGLIQSFQSGVSFENWIQGAFKRKSVRIKQSPYYVQIPINGVHRKAWERAALNGHLSILELLMEISTGAPASKTSDLVLPSTERAVHTSGCPSEALEFAIEAGKLEAAKWLHARLGPVTCREQVFERVAQQGRVDIMSWVEGWHPTDLKLTQRALDLAAGYGHLQMVIWLHLHGVRPTAQAIVLAAENGHTQVLDWLFEHAPDCVLPNSNAWDHAALYGQIEVLDFFTKKNHCWASQQCKHWVKSNRQFRTARWLRAKAIVYNDVRVIHDYFR